MNLHRAEQLRQAVERCEIRLRIAKQNLQDCNPDAERLLMKLRGDFYRASDDLAWMRNRLDEALEDGSAAFRRGLAL